MTPRRAIGLEVEERDCDGTRTLALSGELDLASSSALQRTITRICAAEGTRGLALDLHAVTFIDSTGLAAIIYASRLCERHERDFALIRGSEAVQRLFELTGVTELFPICEDEAEPTQS